MNLICLFCPHKWLYLGRGLYQCIRCKTISWGADRGVVAEKLEKPKAHICQTCIYGDADGGCWNMEPGGAAECKKNNFSRWEGDAIK